MCNNKYVYKGNIMAANHIFYLRPYILSFMFSTVQFVAVYYTIMP